MNSDSLSNPVIVPAALLKRVAQLTSDTAPATLPSPTINDSFELVQQREAESMFQYALRKRTWLRLSPKERATIRNRVHKQDQFLQGSLGTAFFEAACVQRLGELIEASRDNS